MKTLSNPKDLDEIRARIRSLTPDDQRRWGSMTVGGMVCHLADAFRVGTGQTSAVPAKPGPLPASMFKWFALRTPVKWPPGIKTVPEVEQGLGGTPPAEFSADLTELLHSLDVFVGRSAPWPQHPIFGPMTKSDWMRWGYLHPDHHLRQFGR